MKTKYVIKDLISNQYFWTYRAEDGFDNNIESSTKFDTVEDARKEMRNEYLGDLFSGRIIEIKEIYIFE